MPWVCYGGKEKLSRPEAAGKAFFWKWGGTTTPGENSEIRGGIFVQHSTWGVEGEGAGMIKTLSDIDEMSHPKLQGHQWNPEAPDESLNSRP